MDEQDAIDVLLQLKAQPQVHVSGGDVAMQEAARCPRDSSGASASSQVGGAADSSHLLCLSSPQHEAASSPQREPAAQQQRGKCRLHGSADTGSLLPGDDSHEPVSSKQAFEQQSSHDQKEQATSRPSSPPLPARQQSAALKPQPTRVSPAHALLGMALPLALRELAAPAGQAPLSRTASVQQSTTVLAGVTPSPSSAFTPVPPPPKAKRQKASHAARPAPVLPEALLQLLCALPGMPPLLPCMPASPPLVAPDNSSSHPGPASSDSDGILDAPPSPPPAMQQAARFELLKKAAARQAALVRYLQKRKCRNFTKKVLYVSRKRLAEARPRVRGQFVKATVAPAVQQVA